MGETVLITRSGAVWTLSLNRPDRINALSEQLTSDLLAALVAANEDLACRVVLLRGEGRGFCSGQDLTELPSDPDLGHVLRTRYAPLIQLIRTMPKPIVCAVQGVAAGAGANIALACDFVIAGHEARFLQAFVRIGLIPDVGGTWLLPRLLGSARARGVAMLGDAVDGRQAEAWGMIWRAVADEDVSIEAEALAARLATLPGMALGLMKRALEAAETNTLEQQLAVEADSQRQAGYSADFAEGVRAFIEKRPPIFTGHWPESDSE